MEKSIILPWTKENIEKVPEGYGVLMLRSTPVNGDIVLIKISNNLKKDLNLLLDEGGRDDVKYFDWCLTTDEKGAENAKDELIKIYHLENNELG